MRVILMIEKKLWQFSFDCVIIVKIKSTINEPTHNEVKGEGLINCDTKTNISRQSSLEFHKRTRAFIKADHYVGSMSCLFYSSTEQLVLELYLKHFEKNQ